jgi:hypothetical protein
MASEGLLSFGQEKDSSYHMSEVDHDFLVLHRFGGKSDSRPTEKIGGNISGSGDGSNLSGSGGGVADISSSGVTDISSGGGGNSSGSGSGSGGSSDTAQASGSTSGSTVQADDPWVKGARCLWELVLERRQKKFQQFEAAMRYVPDELSFCRCLV